MTRTSHANVLLSSKLRKTPIAMVRIASTQPVQYRTCPRRSAIAASPGRAQPAPGDRSDSCGQFANSSWSMWPPVRPQRQAISMLRNSSEWTNATQLVMEEAALLFRPILFSARHSPWRALTLSPGPIHLALTTRRNTRTPCFATFRQEPVAIPAIAQMSPLVVINPQGTR